MSKRIAYENKIALQNNESIPERNKVTDMNMNEIKDVVNSHATEIEKVSDIDENIQEYLEKQDILEQKYDEQIKELANENPQLPEIVDARQGFDTLGLVIKQKIFHFNSVADMKSCLTLLPGDVVQTLGYYEANDGGGATYRITTNLTVEYDNGAYFELVNGLTAELIVEGNVNIRQFGAKGDGIHNDTTNIQNAIEYLYDKFNNNLETQLYLHRNVLEITSGIYRITDTIDFPNILKMLINGTCEILVDEDNISGMWLNSRGLTRPNVTDSSRHDPGTGNFITSNGGVLVIKKKVSDYDKDNNTSTQSVGLEVGDRNGVISNVSTARCSISNIAIHGFNTGLAINTINMYIINFEQLDLESNNNNIVWGYNGQSINSGEKITFNDCIIASSRRGLITKATFIHMAFNNCSFDFNANPILADIGTRGIITVNGGHLESIGATYWGQQVQEILGFGYFLYYNATEANLRLTLKINNVGCYINGTNSSTLVNHKFGTAKTNSNFASRNLTVYIDSIKWIYENLNGDNSPVKINNIFLADKNTNIYYNSFSTGSNADIFFGSENMDREGTFDYYTDSNISNYRISTPNDVSLNVYNSSNKENNDEKPIFTNALRLKRDTFGTSIALRRDIYSLKSKKIRVLSIFSLTSAELQDTSIENYNIYNSFVFSFFGKDNTLLGTTQQIDVVFNTITSNENNWRAAIAIIEIPSSCERVRIASALRLRNLTNSTYINSWKGTADFGAFMIDFY